MATGGKQVKTVQPERLRGLDPIMGYAKVRPEQRKVLREARSSFPAYKSRSKSNRLIDAQIQFYGQYVQLEIIH